MARFIRHVDGHDFRRLIKDPAAFEMQQCRVSGIRAELFVELMQILGSHHDYAKRPDILDVVTPLCSFAASLPSYVHKTSRLSAEARAVRDAIVKAHEPGTLVFSDLPVACGFAAFSATEEPQTDRVMVLSRF